MVLHLGAKHRFEMVAHCLSAVPNEGCGLFAVDDATVTRVYPTSNAQASPSGYTVPPEEHFAALTDAESRGWVLGGVFHSHPGGGTRPSMTDVEMAIDPQWTYVVIGLRGSPEMRAWRIEDGEISEVEIA